MPTKTAQSIINTAKTTIQDTTGVRWTDPELLDYLNYGQREIAIKRPDAVSVLTNLTLVAGTRQTIPDDGTALLRAVRNMGADGTTPGRAIRHVPMELLDSTLPNWHAATPANETLHVSLDMRKPDTFYVYPPANAGRRIEIIYAAPPADVTNSSNPISVDDIYAGALLDYILFRAYTKDQELSGNDARAQAHRALFDNAIAQKSTSDTAVAASQNVKG